MTNFKVEVFDTITDIDKNQWNSLITKSRLGSIYHRYEWSKAIEDGMDVEPKHIVVLKDNNPVGILPNFIYKHKKTPFKEALSIFPGYGGPIISPKKENEILDLMFEKLSKFFGITLISHHIRTSDPRFIRYDQYFNKKGYQIGLDWCRFKIDLTRNEDYIKSKMYGQRRRNLVQALKREYSTIDEEINETNLKEFYKSYEKVMEKVARRERAYKTPLSFLICLSKEMPERVRIFELFLRDEKIGQFLYLLNKEQSSFIAFLAGADESKYEHYPNIIHHWTGIKWGIEKGYKEYDLGCTRSNFNDGVYSFKEEFGAEVIPTLTWIKHSHFRKNFVFNIGKYLYSRFMKEQFF